jgi:hypothetical protein
MPVFCVRFNNLIPKHTLAQGRVHVDLKVTIEACDWREARWKAMEALGVFSGSSPDVIVGQAEEQDQFQQNQ